MDGVKSLLTSKTFWGAAIAGLSAIAGLFGYTVVPEDQTALVDNVAGLGGVFGALLAIYGRVKASKKIG